MLSNHDKTALRLAHKNGVEYNRGQGPDVKSPNLTIEVETAKTVRDGLRQLRGHMGPVYIAGADAEATKAALGITRGTTIGVMDSKGAILKRSTRSRRRATRSSRRTRTST